MRLIKNSGGDRVIDELRRSIAPQGTLDIATPTFSLVAFSELNEQLSRLSRCRPVLPSPRSGDLALLGSDSDRTYRNRLQTHWLAKQCAAWLESKVDVRSAPGAIASPTLSIGTGETSPTLVITGNCAFTSDGLGLTPINGIGLVQLAEGADECLQFGEWFTGDLRSAEDAKIRCGKAHFHALAVREAPADYVVARTVDDILLRDALD